MIGLKLLLKIWKAFKAAFQRFGGLRNPLTYFLAILLWWGFKAFLYERGWYLKKSVQGKHVFITGAGSGLGRQMAIEFAKLGAKLTVNDIDFESVQKTKEIIESVCSKMKLKNVQVVALKLDVSNREEVRQVAQETKAQIGDVDIIVNNAGIAQSKKFMDMNEFMIRKTMVVNCESHFWIIKEFLGPMLEKNEGHIVSIASAAGLGGVPYMTDYCASKFGAFGMIDALRAELKKDNKKIRTTVICPYFIDTGMFEGVKDNALYPLLQPKDVVQRVVNAVRQEEEMVVMHWNLGLTIPLARMMPVHIGEWLGWLILPMDSMVNVKTRQGTLKQQ